MDRHNHLRLIPRRSTAPCDPGGRDASRTRRDHSGSAPVATGEAGRTVPLVTEHAPPEHPTPEHQRLFDPAWRTWGPYVAERAWGTVREDYSPSGDAWKHLPHDAARSFAYRWGEDGLAGICDDEQRLCLTLGLWNGKDPILKERLFGLANEEGNHGEDVKELYWYTDATPTASLLKWRYHYPQQEYPYADLVEENARRGRTEPEYELLDTGILEHGFWDVVLTVAKAGPEDLCWELTVTNRGPMPETLHVLPTLTFRNGWTFGRDPWRARIRAEEGSLVTEHPDLPPMRLHHQEGRALLCENETNTERLHGHPGPDHPKDGINDHVTKGTPTVRLDEGSRAALHHELHLQPGETTTVRLRLTPADCEGDLGGGFDRVVAERQAEADEFYDDVLQPVQTGGDREVSRQALAGLVWSQCFYHYNVERWLSGDATTMPPPLARSSVRNGAWLHLAAKDVILMPDSWEYPWFAAWDLAFHAVTYAHLDPVEAKRQLLLLTNEWYMHPSGALPAYEWNLSDVNPPVHAWAALEIFHITGGTDLSFLTRVFHRMLLNFTWWVNRQDSSGNSIFEGGFLGMDNIGPFDRSHPAPLGGTLEQSDGTAWMAMFSLDMMQMALHLSKRDAAYEDMALKFFEHFVRIASAMNEGLWDEEGGFYHDLLHLPGKPPELLKVRSMAGLVILAASRMISAETLQGVPEFARRVEWFLANKDEGGVVQVRSDGALLLSAVPAERLPRVLHAVFDEDELYSPHGLRSLSKRHQDAPYTKTFDGVTLGPVTYEPGESQTGLFGGNSNWRGPVWMPMNHLIVTALRRLGQYTGESVTVAVPSRSETRLTLPEAGDALADRLVTLWRKQESGRAPAEGRGEWPEGLLWFHEYFHGETGEGLGASHQTGWTALMADLLIRRNKE